MNKNQTSLQKKKATGANIYSRYAEHYLERGIDDKADMPDGLRRRSKSTRSRRALVQLIDLTTHRKISFVVSLKGG
jgi:hypothetical protein